MKVFLGHSHADAPLAARVSEPLRRSGLEVWDPVSISSPETTGPRRWPVRWKNPKRWRFC